MISSCEFLKDFSLNIQTKNIIADKYGGMRLKLLCKEKHLLIKFNEPVEVLLKTSRKYDDCYLPPVLSIKFDDKSELFQIIKKIEKNLQNQLSKNEVSSLLRINQAGQYLKSIIKISNNPDEYFIYPKLKCQFDKKSGKIHKIFTKFINSNTNKIMQISRYLNINNIDILNEKAKVMLHFDNIYLTASKKIYLQFFVSKCYIEFEDVNIVTSEKDTEISYSTINVNEFMKNNPSITILNISVLIGIVAIFILFSLKNYLIFY
jgi:hypothetical protein